MKMNIITFACNKWGYNAADLAGVSRLKYTPNVKIIRLRCTGRVDIKHLIYAINNGADGVMVVGWQENQCEFKTGNFIAAKHVEFVKRILDRRGLGGDRVNMYNCSGAEAVKFVKSVEDMVSKVEKLGLNPLKTDQAVIKAEIKEVDKKLITKTPIWMIFKMKA